MDIGILTALIGGTLALLSPCGALLLPAFFASTAGSGPRLWAHGGIFSVGLLVVLVPLGLGMGVLGTLFASHREIIIIAASILMIVLGIIQLLGIGFDPSRFIPGAEQLQKQANQRTGWVKTLLLGAVSGVAGLCAGPILGAVLTLAATQNDVWTAGGLLAVYGLGMVVPLLLLASVWGKLSSRWKTRLRGRIFTVFGREFHSTSVITGIIIIAVGVLFWTTNGLVTMPELLPTKTSAWLQESSAILSNPLVDVILLIVVVGIILGVWIRARYRKANLVAEKQN
ncbi:MAG TPA: cytochrome c biogenesis CcdA family protein [Enteractinococcus helveticum]|uniref:Cytochrome c biogenesis CcdA family protein n=1 Tax=Enteractinococcus helveticum TaxID=1837282 RepID=A0A921FL16_9MICC|nr:cytochrome c biogenesis CcdA family protein [Enteractinococcus helveticum]HJF13765.1 cytochrome c biogenesis CcdA family protein [Enteractinococcus helveticum]